MFIQFLRSRTALPEQHEGSWDELVDFLTNVERTETPKDELPCWSPCRLKEPRRVASNVISVSCLVLDFDDITVEQWEEAKTRLEGLSYCYHSSYSHQPISGSMRYRVAVELDKPVPGTAWKRFFAVASAMLGGANDEKCSDPNRLFYGPHAPIDGPEPEVGVGRGIRLPVDRVLSEVVSSTKGQTPKPTGAVTHAALRAILPRRLETVENDNSRKGYTGLLRALDGQPFADRGERHITLLFMSGILSHRFTDNTPEEIVAPLADVLPDPDDDIPADEALRSMLERDLENARAERVAVQQAPAAAAGGRIYAGDELDGYARDLGLNNKNDLVRQLIINTGADYYVFWNGDYISLGGKDRAEIPILTRLAGVAGQLPITLGEETKNGMQWKKLQRLVMDYGQSVTKVRKDLRVQHSRLDLEKDTFVFAVCRRAKLTPEFNAGVDQWLRSWGEPALIDWCATVARLEQPTAGLVLDGAPQTGKSQFAKGVSAIWGERYTPLRDLNSSFNDSISRCPLLYAEESVPWDFRRDTGLLKDLVTSDSQQLRQKYQDNAALAGAVRLIIAKNDHKLFEAGEVLTSGTVSALEDRLLYVHTGYKPAPHFEADAIARHLLWLEKHHQISPSRRAGLWVAGQPSRLHFRLRAFTSKVSISVCHWLLTFIERPTFCGDTGGALHRLDSQGLQVNPKLLYDKWMSFCGNEHKQPTLAQVREALDGISTRCGTLHKIDLRVLAEYADGVTHHRGWYTAEALQGVIERAGVEIQQRKAN